MKYVLLPSRVRYNVLHELAKTFSNDLDDVVLVKMYDGITITNYAEPVQVALLSSKFKEVVDMLRSLIKEGDEVYLITSGSAFHSAFAAKLLMEAGINFKFLVFEKKVGRYAVV